ncbi:MAG TPA: hypothetical protein VLB05_01285, partial [Dongiaceae bacterium]|nr:hypothetical protein [Dongiaceae bacterium]
MSTHFSVSAGRPARPARMRFIWLALVAVPGAVVAAGIAFIVLPAFGYFPALGGAAFSLQPWRDLIAYPGLAAALRA